MALFDSSGAKIERAGAYLDPTDNWTVAFWYQTNTATPSGGTFRQPWLWGDGAGINPYLYIGSPADSDDLMFEIFDGSNYTDTVTYTTAHGTWIYVGVTYTASSHVSRLSVNGVSVGTITVDLSGVTFIETGEVADTGTFHKQAMEYLRIWQQTLTLPQLVTESASVDAVITANQLSDTRLAAVGNLTNGGGAAPDFTVTTGTYSYLPGPLPPSNTTPATATVITTLPYSLTGLDVQDADDGSDAPSCATNEHAVWFKYTATAMDRYLGASAVGSGSDTVTASPWTVTPTQILGICGQTPISVPVVAGSDYYFQVNTRKNPEPLTGTVDFSLQTLGQQTVPVGSLLIPDDTFGFPTTFISTTGGTIGDVLGSSVIPACDCGAMLNSGISAYVALASTNTKAASVDLYNANGGLITSITSIAVANWRRVSPIYALEPDTFYVAVQAGAAVATVYTISDAGVVGGSPWTFPANSASLAQMALAVSVDATTAYYGVATDNTAIHTYDLIGSAAGADFVAGIAQEQCRGIVVLSNTDVMIASTNQTAHSIAVRGYTAAAALQWTRTFAAADNPTICPSASANRLWLRYNDRSTHHSTALYLSAVDGSTVTGPILSDNFENGVNQSTDGDPYGPSVCCPLLETRVAVSPLTTGIDPIRRLRRFEIAYDRHLMQFLRRIEFYCQPGTGLVTGQGSDPTLMFRLSKDGGITWGTEQTMSIGAMGDYTKRAYLVGLGQGRHLVGEISCSDPTTFALVDCLADLDGGTS